MSDEQFKNMMDLIKQGVVPQLAQTMGDCTRPNLQRKAAEALATHGAAALNALAEAQERAARPPRKIEPGESIGESVEAHRPQTSARFGGGQG